MDLTICLLSLRARSSGRLEEFLGSEIEEMSDFRRFYSHGLEHVLHLEQLERSALESKSMSIRSEKEITAIRRFAALALKTLAERIEPSGVPHDSKVTGTIS